MLKVKFIFLGVPPTNFSKKFVGGGLSAVALAVVLSVINLTGF